MSVFIDTGVFYAHHDTDAERHDKAVEAFDAVLDGTYGQPYTCDYVLDEAITLTRKRTGSFAAADRIADRIFGNDPYPDIVELIHTGPDDVAGALATFRQYEDHSLSFTDAMIIEVCQRRGIETLLSFDGDFDGIVERVEC